MSWLKKIFGKTEDTIVKGKINQVKLKIKSIEHITEDAVKVVFSVPEEVKEKYQFIPGQYVNTIIEIGGKEENRSYSICSGIDEDLAIGVRKIKDGVVSTYFKEQATVGEEITVTFPLGNFKLKTAEGNYIAIVGGSGITPVLSIAKSINKTQKGHLQIFYGNREEKTIMFAEELSLLSPEKVKVTPVFSEQKKEGVLFGLLTEELIFSFLKEIPDIKEIDGIYICGPEQVIINAQKAAENLGVNTEKIYYELFTTPVKIESTSVIEKSGFEGVAKVTVILDGEEEVFELATDGETILGEAESYGLDAPYSCRGGICCSCRAKVLKGSAVMDQNYTLSEEEVKEGYILTCQAHPDSPELIVSYDE